MWGVSRTATHVHRNRSSKLLRGAFCATFRADPESAHECGERGGPKLRAHEIRDSNPQSSNPQRAHPFFLLHPERRLVSVNISAKRARRAAGSKLERCMRAAVRH
eukprot:9200881-Alexandrium_andersonii.AAC.1